MTRFLTYRSRHGKSAVGRVKALPGPRASRPLLDEERAGRPRSAEELPSAHHTERRKSIAGALERHLADPAILLHPADQIIDRVEREFWPDPRDHRHVEAAVVEVAGEIEQKHFEQHHSGVEHRPPAEIRHAIEPPAAD